MSENKGGCATKARIGIVKYINTAPIHEVWKETINNPEWQLVEGHPAALNRQLAAGEIDLGFVSSLEYAQRPQQYQVLADLSISANGPVGSVFLFSQIPVEQLNNRTVLLSAESKTSSCLVRVILERFYQISPAYHAQQLAAESFADFAGIMAIGDDALRLKHSGFFPYCLDLGECWQRATELPFVFALCVVRERYLAKNPSQVAAIREALIACRDIGLNQLDSICDRVAAKIPMSKNACIAYLHGIEYDLDPKKLKALELFFTTLQDLGALSKEPIPIKLCHP